MRAPRTPAECGSRYIGIVWMKHGSGKMVVGIAHIQPIAALISGTHSIRAAPAQLHRGDLPDYHGRIGSGAGSVNITN